MIGTVLAGLLVGSAQAASYEVRLPASEARAMVRRTGGFVHRCERLAPRRFQCTATYWKIMHVGEEVEPSVVVELYAEPVSEEATLIVSLYSVRRV